MTETRPPEEPTPPPTSPPPPQRRPQLRRSTQNRVLGGVCGGLGEYFDIDPVVVRIVFIVLAFAGGAGVLIYLLMWIFVPQDTEGAAVAAEGEPVRADGGVIAGIILVCVGAFLLARAVFPDWFEGRYVWPIVLIILGIAIAARAARR